jgi:hypothetical protein
MSGIATAIGGSAILGYMGSQDAAQTQADAANAAQAQQLAMFNTQNQQLAPQRAAGYNALNTIGTMLPGQTSTYDAQGNPVLDANGKPVMQEGTGYLTKQFDTYKPFTNQDLNANLAPNYDWQLKQGQQANQYANNATGGLVGGNAMKSLEDYTQNYAGNAYQNALNNYMTQQQAGFNQNQTQRTNIYNTLASIAGFGQTANNTSANLSANTANALSSLGTGAAAANAAGTIGSTSAITGGINNLGNMGYLGNLLNPSSSGSNNLYSNSVPSYFGNGAGAPAAYSNPPSTYVA